MTTWADDSHFLPRREAEAVVARRSLEMISITADIAEETILRGLVTRAIERVTCDFTYLYAAHRQRGM